MKYVCLIASCLLIVGIAPPANAQDFLNRINDTLNKVDSSLNSMDRTMNRASGTANRVNEKLPDAPQAQPQAVEQIAPQAGTQDEAMSAEDQEILRRAAEIQMRNSRRN